MRNVKKQLRIIYQTPPSSPHPFSVHPRISEEVQEKVLDAFVILSKDPTSQILLNNIQIPEPIPADYATDYQFLEDLGLETFFVTDSQ